jgi:valyl-tRNA synthetase
MFSKYLPFSILINIEHMNCLENNFKFFFFNHDICSFWMMRITMVGEVGTYYRGLDGALEKGGC